jgi:hypothetical protein
MQFSPRPASGWGSAQSRLHELAARRWKERWGADASTRGPAGCNRSSGAAREAELEARVKDLEVDLQAALVRTELALAMPHLFEGGGKKNSSAWGRSLAWRQSQARRLRRQQERVSGSCGHGRAGSESEA